MISRILQLLLIDIMSVDIPIDSRHAKRDGEREAQGRRLLISHIDI